jgi:hypothetical protein
VKSLERHTVRCTSDRRESPFTICISPKFRGSVSWLFLLPAALSEPLGEPQITEIGNTVAHPLGPAAMPSSRRFCPCSAAIAAPRMS